MLNFRTLTLAACLAACSLPALADPVWIYQSTDGAGPLGQSWNGAWQEGWDVIEGFSQIGIGANTLSYSYDGAGAWFGTPVQTYVFGTTAAKAGALTLNVDLNSNAPWDDSVTSMYIWQGDTGHSTLLAGATGDAIVSRTVTLNLGQDEAWGFMAVSGSLTAVNDNQNTGPLYGSFTVTDAATGGEVPEPASLALIGLGVLGLIAFRRKV